MAALLPVPADFHDLGCECTIDKEIGGDAFTVPARTADFEFASAAAVYALVCSAEWDLRIASFRGPPRLASDHEKDHALRGRLLVVESTRLNI